MKAKILKTNRYELKFYLNYYDYHLLRTKLLAICQPDPYMTDPNGYMVRSLYFDDPSKSSLETKLDGVLMREKYRIRIYEPNAAKAKFEIKKKLNNQISKESYSLNKNEVLAIEKGEDYSCLLKQNLPGLNKIYSLFRSYYYRPTSLIQYTREAYLH
ncbi:hypothetical protein BVY03_00255, partial [bacterium K02(2017)]